MPGQQAVFEALLKLPDVTADGAWSPHIDVRELPDEYIVLADLPGVAISPLRAARCAMSVSAVLPRGDDSESRTRAVPVRSLER